MAELSQGRALIFKSSCLWSSREDTSSGRSGTDKRTEQSGEIWPLFKSSLFNSGHFSTPHKSFFKSCRILYRKVFCLCPRPTPRSPSDILFCTVFHDLCTARTNSFFHFVRSVPLSAGAACIFSRGGRKSILSMATHVGSPAISTGGGGEAPHAAENVSVLAHLGQLSCARHACSAPFWMTFG